LRSKLTVELIPLSTNLRQVAEMGLKALDQLQSRRAMTEAERGEALAFLKKSEKPQAVLVNMIVPAVEVLVQAIQK